MVQISLLVMSAGLLLLGVQALCTKEKPGKETPKGVAIALLVIAAALAVFSLVFLPKLLPL